MIERGAWLVAGGSLSLAATLAHIACVAGGPNWYRAMGAGERFAQAAERGDWRPAAITFAIAGILALSAALNRPDLSASFLIWSSLIVLVFGLIHAMGTWRTWNFM